MLKTLVDTSTLMLLYYNDTLLLGLGLLPKVCHHDNLKFIVFRFKYKYLNIFCDL